MAEPRGARRRRVPGNRTRALLRTSSAIRHQTAATDILRSDDATNRERGYGRVLFCS
jgi:hypothetical protein